MVGDICEGIYNIHLGDCPLWEWFVEFHENYGIILLACGREDVIFVCQ